MKELRLRNDVAVAEVVVVCSCEWVRLELDFEGENEGVYELECNRLSRHNANLESSLVRKSVGCYTSVRTMVRNDLQ
jgi:hypothetical protein